jgi:hypothetical protein
MLIGFSFGLEVFAGRGIGGKGECLFACELRIFGAAFAGKGRALFAPSVYWSSLGEVSHARVGAEDAFGMVYPWMNIQFHGQPSRSVTARLRESEPPILPDSLALDLSIE